MITRRAFHITSAKRTFRPRVPRHIVKASKHTGCDMLPIFQASRDIRVSIHDIEDLKEATSSMKLDDKLDYFESNGVNYKNVVKYYDYVMKLNKLLESSERPSNQNVAKVIKKLWLSIVFAVSYVFS